MTEQTLTIKPWRLYQATGKPNDAITRLPDAPPWRHRHDVKPIERKLVLDQKRVETFNASDEEIDTVNTALYLRRPLLVTGPPGSGKSSLARAVAYELGLGEILSWPINTRSSLNDGLYRYDAIGRLQEAARLRDAGGVNNDPRITDFLQLGPLGTALAPWSLPRVLLIDEIDKGDVDLPNDLLHVFEEGKFKIPELARPTEANKVNDVATEDGQRVPIKDGWVFSYAFPFIVLTSNAEREFPPAFLRRCIRLDIKPPDKVRLAAIVESHLGKDAAQKHDGIIQAFLERRDQGTMATDQLLNAIYLVERAAGLATDKDQLVNALLRDLGGA